MSCKDKKQGTMSTSETLKRLVLVQLSSGNNHWIFPFAFCWGLSEYCLSYYHLLSENLERVIILKAGNPCTSLHFRASSSASRRKAVIYHPAAEQIYSIPNPVLQFLPSHWAGGEEFIYLIFSPTLLPKRSEWPTFSLSLSRWVFTTNLRVRLG